MPSTWLAANAVCTKPITRPRWKKVGNDGKNDGANHAAEQSGHDPADQEHVIIRRKGAERGSRGESEIEKQQKPFAVEAVGEAGRQDPGNARAERIGRDGHAELSGGDIERRHDNGAERRHDHEVENERKLDERQQRDKQRLVAGEADWLLLLLLLRIIDRRGQGLFSHDAHCKETRQTNAKKRAVGALKPRVSADMGWLKR